MVNINDEYAKSLKVEHLNGQALNVTIANIEIREFKEGKKGVIYAHGFDQGLVLNVTNKNSIVEMYGPETDDWIGKQICLFPTTTEMQGKITPCIRIRRPEVGAHNQEMPSQQTQITRQFQAPQDGSHMLPRQMPAEKPQDYNELNPPPPTRDDFIR